MINNIQPASAGALIESPLLSNKKTILDDKKTIAYHHSNLLRSAYDGNLRNGTVANIISSLLQHYKR